MWSERPTAGYFGPPKPPGPPGPPGDSLMIANSNISRKLMKWSVASSECEPTLVSPLKGSR